MPRRVTILAGAGALVPEVMRGAEAAGDRLQVLPLVERRDLGLTGHFGVPDIPRLLWRIVRFRTTHITMVGGLRASDAERDAFKRFAMVGRGRPTGDASLLAIAERLLRMTGAKIVGAETIAPGILADEGRIAGPPLEARLLPVAVNALRVARAIGALDIGQAVVAAPGRIVAVEDVAGTDALIARVGQYRSEGLAADVPLVLAKALKPQQSRAVDRPAIGPDTVRLAAAAGISAIVVEAGGAIIIDRAGVLAAAEELHLPIVGLRADA